MMSKHINHGDQLGERGKLKKGTPYESSAGIPFLVRFPKKVKKGKIIEIAYSSIDFAPTILNLMGVKNTTSEYYGIDASSELLSHDNVTSLDQIRFSFDTGKKNRWASAMSNGYKLVVSRFDVPWFFNLTEDPDELYNGIDDPRYSIKVSMMKQALLDETSIFSDTFFSTKPILWDTPVCIDSRDDIATNFTKESMFCSQLGHRYSVGRCESDVVKRQCPRSCGTCCKDSEGSVLIRNKQVISCSDLELELEPWICKSEVVEMACPELCGLCDIEEIKLQHS